MYEEFDRNLHCRADDDWSHLHQTAQKFMKDLNLSNSHPRCFDETTFSKSEYLIPTLESLQDDVLYEKQMGWGSQLYTVWCQAAPALLAMGELWLRLFAFVLAPLIILYLMTSEFMRIREDVKKIHWDLKEECRLAIMIVIGLAASLVLLTDTMYVFCNDGRHYGASCFLFMIILSLKRITKFQFYGIRTFGAMLIICFLSWYLIVNSDPQGSGIHDHPGLDIPTIEPGFYYSEENKFMAEVAKAWPEQKRIYSVENGATPYLPTGDSLTGIPFLVNKSEKLDYHRVWVQNKIDKEAVALDIKFPSDGIHSTEKPVFLILHGLNGGSHEDYVQEFIGRRTVEGYTCIVMIARGLMDTPVIGWNVFHGARILDIDVTANAVSNALARNQLLAGVGYSMGAIILSNYVARSGKKCHLDSAMAISGGLDMREMLNFKRGMRLWQPMLAQTLREDFIINKFDNRFRIRLTPEEHLKLMRSTSVSEIDIYAIVSYNGFDDLEHYYSEMSAMGDTTLFGRANATASVENVGRIADVSIPFCVMHALDDPLTNWRTIGDNPSKLVETGSGYLMMLLTKSGGHVGWPLGTNPKSNGWKFMNDAALDFALSVDVAKKSFV